MIELTLTPAQNNWLAVTWTDVVQAPDVIIPEVPGTLDDEGNEETPYQPARIEPGAINRNDLKHTSYHPTQLALLQADAETMGTPLDYHMDMLEAWVDSYVPPPPEPEPVPQVLTMRQARLVLLGVDLLDDVEAAVSAAGRAVAIEWEFATEVRRDWPTLKALAGALGWGDSEIDALFVAGAKL